MDSQYLVAYTIGNSSTYHCVAKMALYFKNRVKSAIRASTRTTPHITIAPFRVDKAMVLTCSKVPLQGRKEIHGIDLMLIKERPMLGYWWESACQRRISFFDRGLDGITRENEALNQ